MTVTLQKIVEQVDTLSQKEREELGRFLAKGMARKQVRPLDQAQLLASIRQGRSFCVTVQVVGRASRLPGGRLALGFANAGETPGAAGETPAPLPEQLPFCPNAYDLPGSLQVLREDRRR